MMELVGAGWAILQTLHRSTASLIMLGEDNYPVVTKVIVITIIIKNKCIVYMSIE